MSGQYYIDPQKPGIIRAHDGDALTGWLVGVRAKEFVTKLNCHDELVEVLEVAEIFARNLKYLSSIWNESDDSDLEKIRQAIAKAKGET